jgi:hypothetical protein
VRPSTRWLYEWTVFGGIISIDLDTDLAGARHFGLRGVLRPKAWAAWKNLIEHRPGRRASIATLAGRSRAMTIRRLPS